MRHAHGCDRLDLGFLGLGVGHVNLLVPGVHGCGVGHVHWAPRRISYMVVP